MARSSKTHDSAPDLDAINLSRALSRLEAKILAQPPPSRLLRSSFERQKTAANLEYARTLLLRLEHKTAHIKVQSRKHAAQTTLQQQRASIKRLTDRLYEIGQADTGALSDSSDSEDGESIVDILGLTSGASQSTPSASHSNGRDTSANPSTAAPPLNRAKDAEHADGERGMTGNAQEPSRTTLSHEPESTLRARHALLGRGKAAGDSSQRSTTTAHSLRPPSSPSSFTATAATHQKGGKDDDTAAAAAGGPSNATASRLENADGTQAALTASMVSLATALKKSAQAFSADLAADEAAVGGTEAALGKNISGLDAATGRMGVLRRMSEGRWWWGRMVLYAAIAALWVVALLLVFVAPKLRW